MNTFKTFLVRLVLLFVLAFVPELALASTVYDSGLIAFTPVGTQFGRISRNGQASDWSGPKLFPGVTGAPTSRAYDVITVNSGPFPFLQILLDDPTASLFAAAYLTPYTPINIAPNYGLDVNYLGDPGLSQPFRNPSFFQVAVAPNTDVLIVINELSPGGGLNKPFQLLVEGFFDTSYKDTLPISEASSLFLFGSGALVVGVVHRTKRRVETKKLNVSSPAPGKEIA